MTHAIRPVERPFTRAQRPFTTVLFGGLTWKHERLIQAVLQGLGYRAEFLPTPTIKSYQTGREYCNNGHCNPAYFTIGNLIDYLNSLEAKGMGKQEIIDQYVFFTAGACGPCRFGMYEAEYRLALRNSGYEGFRVLILQQTGGLEQSSVDAGLVINRDFTLGILHAIMIADVLNDTAYQIRPYEVDHGATDEVLRECIEHMASILFSWKRKASLRVIQRPQDVPHVVDFVISALRWGEYLFGRRLVKGMRWCRERFARIEVDRTRVRPVVKLTGEFWAQTTEGDGNFEMFRFLESEGAQVLVDPVTNWLLYLLYLARQEAHDMRKKSRWVKTKFPSRLYTITRAHLSSMMKITVYRIAEFLLTREYNRMRRALDFVPFPLTPQGELQKLAHPYFHTRIEGGEGHLEVAKTIYFTRKRLCHMVLSLKPFGCMPSTQSDGVQSAVTTHFHDILFLPIETSGEGEINAHSRVQMALGEAKTVAREEMRQTLHSLGMSEDDLRHIVKADKSFRDPFQPLPRRNGLVGIAPRLALSCARKEKRLGVKDGV
ncbi:MAG: activator of (R)-2-hydroxyglutaryl-CoA dehydratase [Bacteroidota bacterium]|nr:activator of (R)-2-hydroxyglutaryl-CoA dehydratase [Bacteroidota bacterium]